MVEKANQEKADIKERLCHALDISPDIFPNGTLIEIRGRNSVTVSGAGGVTVYTDTEIRFAIRGGEIRILGQRLCCASYHKGCAVVDGLIGSVSFEENEI